MGKMNVFGLNIYGDEIKPGVDIKLNPVIFHIPGKDEVSSEVDPCAAKKFGSIAIGTWVHDIMDVCNEITNQGPSSWERDLVARILYCMENEATFLVAKNHAGWLGRIQSIHTPMTLQLEDMFEMVLEEDFFESLREHGEN